MSQNSLHLNVRSFSYQLNTKENVLQKKKFRWTRLAEASLVLSQFSQFAYTMHMGFIRPCPCFHFLLLGELVQALRRFPPRTVRDSQREIND